MNVLLIPKGCTRLMTVRLQDPKSGEPQDYYYDEDNIAIYENVQYQDDFRSWFFDNQFCKEGHLSILTRVDPLFIMIPRIREVTGSQFRSLQDICSSSESSQYVLDPDTKWSNICDTRNVDDELYIRWSESKTINWLVAKREVIMKVLQKQQVPPSKAMSYANDFLAHYISSDLCNKLTNARIKGQISVASQEEKAVNSRKRGTLLDYF